MASNDLLTVKQVAIYLNIKIGTIYSKLLGIPHYKIGRLIRFKKEEIDLWLEGNKKNCVAPDKVARKALRVTGRTNVDVDRIVRKAIDGVTGTGYTDSCGKTRPSQRPQKGGF